MARGSLLLLILLSCTRVFCQECVTYDFKNNFYEMFTSGEGVCAGSSAWKLHQYDESDDFQPFHDSSTTYISPQEDEMFSCTSSFSFQVDAGGKLEVNFYMDVIPNTPGSVQLSIILLDANGNTIEGPFTIFAVDGKWDVFNYTFSAHNTVTITFLSVILQPEAQSIIIVDSFRYIPLEEADGSCAIYEESPNTPSPASTGTTDTASSTDAPLTTGTSDLTSSTDSPLTTETSDLESTSDPSLTTESSTSGPPSDPTTSTESGSPSTNEASSSEPASDPTTPSEASTLESSSNTPSTIEASSSEPASNPTTPSEDSTPESSSNTPSTIEASSSDPASDPTTLSSTPETSSDSPSSTSDPSVITTTGDDQTTHDDTKESYWNAVTITVLVAVIVGVVVLCYLFYKLVKREKGSGNLHP